MKKKNFTPYIILGIVFALFNVLAFIIPTDKTTTFWLAYAFSIVAFLVQVVIIKLTIAKNEELKSKFLGFSIIHIGIVYLILQLVAFAVFMAIPTIPYWVTIIVCALILGIAVICMISTKTAVQEIKRIDEKVEEKVFYIKSLQADIETLVVVETDNEVKTALQDLAKSIRFSDPMSNEALADLEAKIADKVEQLKTATDKISVVKELELMIVERNKKCKLLK